MKIIILFFITLSFNCFSGEQKIVKKIANKVYAPEGLTKSSDGKYLYLTSFLEGKVYKVKTSVKSIMHSNKINQIIDLKLALPNWDTNEHKLLGVTCNSKDDLFLVSPTYRGGSIIKLARYSNKYHAKVIIDNAGYLNDVAFDEKKNTLYVTAQKEKQIQRYKLNGSSRFRTISFDERKHLLGVTENLPNGIIIFNEDTLLYNSSNFTDSMVNTFNINDKTSNIVHQKSGAWFDGIFMDVESRVIFVSDNKNGEIDILKDHHYIRTLELIENNTDFNFGPAEITYINGKIYTSDLWAPSMMSMVAFELYDAMDDYFDINKNSAYSPHNGVLEIQFNVEDVLTPDELFQKIMPVTGRYMFKSN